MPLTVACGELGGEAFQEQVESSFKLVSLAVGDEAVKGGALLGVEGCHKATEGAKTGFLGRCRGWKGASLGRRTTHDDRTLLETWHPNAGVHNRRDK
jgi:hypothetical protein